MLKDFWEGNKIIIGFTGFLATISGLFLNIPASESGKVEMENIQVFWLISFVISLSFLFTAFIKLVMKVERNLSEKYDFQIFHMLSTSVGILFTWITLNIVSYIVNLNSFSNVFEIMFPTLIMMCIVFFVVFLSKSKSVPFILFVCSFIFSSLLTLLLSLLQYLLHKDFSDWLIIYGYPGVFLVCLAILFIPLLTGRKSR